MTNLAAAVRPSVPHLIFIAPARRPPTLIDAWHAAIARYFPASGPNTDDSRDLFSVREGRLGDLDPEDVQHDCIVSPANSYGIMDANSSGIMDGGFDLELSRIFQGDSSDPYALTDHVQRVLRARWNGYAPPGTCTLVALPTSVAGKAKNAWGTHTLAVLPTMKRPEDVGWNRELVYNTMWALLSAVSAWNAVSKPTIRRVLMTGLGTGTGGVSAEVCAREMVLAVRDYRAPLPPQVRWPDVEERADELDRAAGGL